MDDKLMTIDEVASHFNIAIGTLRQKRSRQRLGIPAVRIGRSIRFRREEVEQFAERRDQRSHDLMTLREVASYLNIGVTTLRLKRYRDKLGLSATQIGGMTYFDRKEIQAFVDRNTEGHYETDE